MKDFKTNLHLNINSTASQLSSNMDLNLIPTAELYDPSINVWQQYFDNNSDNSSDLEITLEQYLTEEFTDESNNSEERHRSASGGRNSIADMLAEVNIQKPEVYAYTNNQLVYTESAQCNYQTNVEDVMTETQIPFINSSSDMSEHTSQYENMQQQFKAHSSDFYSNIQEYTISNSQCSIVSSVVTQQEPTESPLDLDSICELNYACFTYAAVDPYPTPQVHEIALTDTMAPTNQCQNSSMAVYYPNNHKLNNLNEPPNATSNRMGIDRKRMTQSMTEMPFNISLDQNQNLALSRNRSEPNMSCVANKRNMDQRQKRKEGSSAKKTKSLTAKEKREILEYNRLTLECSNDDLRTQLQNLETEIWEIRQICVTNGLIPHDFKYNPK